MTAKTKRPDKRPENDRLPDEGGGGNNRSPKDRFWRLARQYLRQGAFGNPWDWMNANDGMEAAQESQEDYFDSMEDFYQGMPGHGQYVGDHQVDPATGQVVPGGSQTASQSPYGSLGGQVTPESLFPPTGPTEPPIASGGGPADLALANTGVTQPAQAQAQPTAQPASYQGAPPDQVALAQKYGQEFGVDPGLLLAIAKHETQFGEAGLGRKGLTLGYGAYDSGPSMKWAGPEAQYKGAASTLSRWGAKSIDDVMAGRASAYATDPKWEAGINSAYKSLGGQLNPAQKAQTALDPLEQVFAGIEAGTVDPSVLDTLGPALSSTADTIGQTADEAEADLEDEDDE